MPWSLTIHLDASAYPLGVVQRTAYALAHHLSILISQKGNEISLAVSPVVAPDAGHTCISASSAKTQITKSLNDFVLRDLIRQETHGIRELLTKAALKECGA